MAECCPHILVVWAVFAPVSETPIRVGSNTDNPFTVIPTRCMAARTTSVYGVGRCIALLGHAASREGLDHLK